MADLTVEQARSIKGTLAVPGDKSISHRALLLAALSQGRSPISGCLDSEDVRTTRAALEMLGIRIQDEGKVCWVEGRPQREWRAPAVPLPMGNSGTTARLLMGILAGCPFASTLVGDSSLSQRPMRRVTEPLERMGASFEGPNGPERLPLTIRGGRLRGIRYTLPVASAQVKSALLLAGLAAEGKTFVKEPLPTRDHTERMLSYLGARLVRQGQEILLEPGQVLRARPMEVPGDFSSAAFFFAAAAVIPGSRVTVRGVGLNPTRIGLLEVLRRMGARVESQRAEAQEDWEPRGDVTVSHGGLRGICLRAAEIPGLIDELPVLMVAATQAEGPTRIEGAGELRFKETDRIRSMLGGLSAMGALVRSEGDTVVLEGPSALRGAAVDSQGDHRTAMALAVAGLAAQGRTTIRGSEWIGISFPGFPDLLAALRH